MQDKILKIAESIFPDKNIRLMISPFSKGEEVYVGEKPMGYFHFPASQFNTEKRFNPYENDADAFKVLEALIKNREVKICEWDGFIEKGTTVYFGDRRLSCHRTPKGAICDAYLSLIDQDKEG